MERKKNSQQSQADRKKTHKNIDFSEDIQSISDEEKEEESLQVPPSLPLLPVRDIVTFPYMIIPLFVGREASIRAIDEALNGNRMIMLSTQNNPEVDSPTQDDLYAVGTVALVIRMVKMGDERVKILVQGVRRARILDIESKTPYLRVSVTPLEEEEPDQNSLQTEAMVRLCKEKVIEMVKEGKGLPPDFMVVVENMDSPGKLADLVVSNLNLKVPESQEVLETLDCVERLKTVIKLLDHELSLLKLQQEIQSETQQVIGKTQKDYFLREQMKAIRKELGEYEDVADEISDFQERIAASSLSAKAREEAQKQLKRLSKMHGESAEATTVRTYIECLLELPWGKYTKDNLNIKKANKILDDDHYGLKKIKDRILEHLSVRKLNKETKGPLLCFVGPPGVGKTSLGRSIAKAMNRKFVRISLGGVRDEAEIRGHRRTYVGALPGRIIQGLKSAGSSNPLFMLDEIDKLGSDFRGDPSAALLEVLDPEQNHNFTDHYLGIEYDLSKVMFIATANVADPIPSPLRDRMEVIQLSGYSLEEKVEIAKRYIIPRCIKENGLSKLTIRFSPNTVKEIITSYTREAGLRNLERKIGEVCRKIARIYAEENNRKSFTISTSSLQKYLGTKVYLPESDEDIDPVGTVTGLAWTSAGGEIMHIEAVLMKGKGNLTITGQLGDVMKESAQTALSFIRSQASYFKLDSKIFEKNDFHIHVPAGAIPKDGPSAGITIATALLSAIGKKEVMKGYAMTGEITLRGRVLPIGGLKEKSLAALRTGVKHIIIPKENEKDLADIPENLRKELSFHPVSHFHEVVDLMFPVASDKG